VVAQLKCSASAACGEIADAFRVAGGAPAPVGQGHLVWPQA
jgi:hypothetical protein